MTELYWTHISDTVSVPLSDYRRAKPESALNMTAEALLIYALKAGRLPLDIRTAEHGKPYIERERHFSISHSVDIVLVVVSDKPVGADVQTPVEPERGLKIAERFFTEDEKELIRKQPECFTRLWTRKEAYVKFTGEGLKSGLANFSVLDDIPGCVFTDGEISEMNFCVCAAEKCDKIEYTDAKNLSVN